MIRIPGDRPPVTPPIQPKEVKAKEEAQEDAVSRPHPPPKEGSKGPELDARAIAVRMAAMASEVKQKELSFEEIIEKAISETGMTNPDAAVEEASKRLHEEIEQVLEQIKSDKELMEEAESWQAFGDVLEHELSQEQIASFFEILKESIRSI